MLADIRGSFGQISQVKTSVRALESLESKHAGADIHDTKARMSTTLRGFPKHSVSKKLWAEFHSLQEEIVQHGGDDLASGS